MTARIRRNGNRIYIEELNGAEKTDRSQVVVHHDAEMGGCQTQFRDIEAALARCEDGTYGICIDCHTLILPGRLEAIPTAKRCMSCQSNKTKPRGMIFVGVGVNPRRLTGKGFASNMNGRRRII